MSQFSALRLGNNVFVIFRQDYPSRRDVRTRVRRHDVGHQASLRPQGHHEPGQGLEAALIAAASRKKCETDKLV